MSRMDDYGVKADDLLKLVETLPVEYKTSLLLRAVVGSSRRKFLLEMLQTVSGTAIIFTIVWFLGVWLVRAG